MSAGHSSVINDTPTPLNNHFSVAACKEPRLMRQCPKCLRQWPFDWDYCPDCAISLRGREIKKQIIHLVPSEDWATRKQDSMRGTTKYAEGVCLSCEVQCDADPLSPEHFRQAKMFMDVVLEAMSTHGGTVWVLPNLGIASFWDGRAANTDLAVRAATKILTETPPSDRKESWQSFGVSLGIGIVSWEARSKSTNDIIGFCFRLASLAHPNGGLVDDAVYEETVEHFDYRGVWPTVPRSEPLPEPVYKLIGAKPERSGTHHTAPDAIPMVGRHELLKVLDDCCREVADGSLVVLHLIGVPGVGKSRLLREWLHENQRLAGWIRLYVHGVPYGGYPLRAWSHLVNSLMDSDGEDSTTVLRRPEALEDVMTDYLRRLMRPALIVVDDLHWIDVPSRNLLVRFLDAVPSSPALVVLAYRPSFVNELPRGKPAVHRLVFLGELGGRELKRLIMMIATERKIDLPRECCVEIVSKAQGNPLYAIEAIGYLTERGMNVSAGSLPSSLAELLIRRIQLTLDTTLPRIEQEVRLAMGRFAFVGDSKNTLERLETLEEQVAAWLDRFDVIQQESPPVVRKFLRGLKEIDGSLALLKYFPRPAKTSPLPIGAGPCTR